MWLEVAWGRSVPAGAACWEGPKALSCLLGPFLAAELLGDLVGVCWASGPLAGPRSRCVCGAPAGQVLSVAWSWQTGPWASWLPSCHPGVLSPDAGTHTGLDSVPARPVLPLPPRSLAWGSTGPRQAAAGLCSGHPREGAPRGLGVGRGPTDRGALCGWVGSSSIGNSPRRAKLSHQPARWSWVPSLPAPGRRALVRLGGRGEGCPRHGNSLAAALLQEPLAKGRRGSWRAG